MKDEEMAEEYLDEKCKDCYMCSYSEHKNPYKICQRRKDRKQAFLAGLKAGRPQLHNLEKDPNDLPKDEKDVQVLYQDCDKLNTYNCVYDIHAENWLYYNLDNMVLELFPFNVIAWCELSVPPKESE